MKRTKERFGKLEGYNKEGISGCKVFDGEDLEYQDRITFQQCQQKNWIEQQKYEREQIKQCEQQEDQLYADQVCAINRTRSVLEAEHHTRRKDMNRMIMEYNKKLAEQKKDREMKSKYDETSLDCYNIEQANNTRSDVYSKLKNEIDSAKSTIC